MNIKRKQVLSAAACTMFLAQPVVADEGGASFWLPGQFASFAATQAEPGWAMPMVYYHTSADARASRDFLVGGNLVAGIEADADLVFLAPGYTFADPVLGGQAGLSLVLAGGRMEVGADVVIAGPGGNTVNASRVDSVSGGADLYPLATLKWNRGNGTWLAYAMGGIPVGAYKVGRLANIGLNHWSLDAGGGYTYLNTTTGREFSIVGGLTCNFENGDTDYQNGIDGHVDWAVSQFLNEQWHVGLVGYVYHQLTGDSGSGATLGDFKSKVYAVGPETGRFFPVGEKQGYVSLRGYFEFDASNRVEGWNTWLTVSYPF